MDSIQDDAWLCLNKKVDTQKRGVKLYNADTQLYDGYLPPKLY